MPLGRPIDMVMDNAARGPPVDQHKVTVAALVDDKIGSPNNDRRRRLAVAAAAGQGVSPPQLAPQRAGLHEPRDH